MEEGIAPAVASERLTFFQVEPALLCWTSSVVL